MTVLIVSNKLDPHADLVINELRARKASYFRLNTDFLHSEYDICLSLGSQLVSFWIENRKNGKNISTSQISKIWWRRPQKLSADDSYSVAPHLQDYVAHEYFRLLHGIATVAELSGVKFVNLPNAMLMANNKASQHIVASQLGFEVVEGFFTNNNKGISRNDDNGYIIKPIDGSESITLTDGREMTIFTNTISRNELFPESSIYLGFEASYIQRRVYPVKEYRVTVIGNDVFAFSINNSHGDKNRVDWRREDINNISFSRLNSFPLSNLCLAYNERFGLNYSAFDFIEDDCGIKFLECNPNGQFLFLNSASDNVLLECFCDYLLSA